MENSLILCNYTTKHLYDLDKVYVTICSKCLLDKYKNDNESNLIYCVSRINDFSTDCYVNYNNNMQYRLFDDLFVAITKTPITKTSKEVLCKEQKLDIIINLDIANYYKIIICIY